MDCIISSLYHRFRLQYTYIPIGISYPRQVFVMTSTAKRGSAALGGARKYLTVGS